MIHARGYDERTGHTEFPRGTCGMRADNAALHFSIDEYIKLFSHKNPLAEQRDS
ncbi:hypothetical protein [Acidovorax sp. SDU_ACID1]|uniref:hypothetical protein n=1 Tax=Acidovorax sp. SDU_ACID1 TaxID=3136632 RepID=UPI003872ABDD